MALFDESTTSVNQAEIMDLIQRNSHDPDKSLEAFYERVGDARIVLLGEASHGTHEYYIWRARISRYLIENKRFNIIGVEGDWPDCYRINRYIRGFKDSGTSATDVLRQFNRWPAWMWANWEISALMEALKAYNKEKPFERQAGFYGLDVYSLWESLEAIKDYLRENDPDALKTAEEAIHCFEPYGMEGADYGAAARIVPETCEQEVLDLLKKIRARMPLYDSDPEGPFNAEQNAMTALNAERYYRAMMSGGAGSWNIRDTHMTDTLERLLDFHGPESRAIVWEHNTHIGDARATDMSRGGMVNVGQLAREKWGRDKVVSMGFGSYRGSVIAADSWGSEMKSMNVPPAPEGTWENLLHKALPGNKLIITDDIKNYPLLSGYIGHRAIGVVYHPERERMGNYVPSKIPERYDAFLFIDETRALHPIITRADKDLVPETYPWGL